MTADKNTGGNRWIRWFDDIGMADVPAVGGKNASLGEMRRALTPLGIRIPDGFATTSDAYRAFLSAANLEAALTDALGRLDVASDREGSADPGRRRRAGQVCGGARQENGRGPASG